MLQLSPPYKNFVLKISLIRTIKSSEIVSFLLFYCLIYSLLHFIIFNDPLFFVPSSQASASARSTVLQTHNIHNYRVPFLFYHETTGLVLSIPEIITKLYTIAGNVTVTFVLCLGSADPSILCASVSCVCMFMFMHIFTYIYDTMLYAIYKPARNLSLL